MTRAACRILFAVTMLGGCLGCGGAASAWAQQPPPTDTNRENADQESPAQTSLDYAAESAPKNALVLAIHAESDFDSNVFSNNQRQVGDFVFLGGALLSLRASGARGRFRLDYRPDYQSYGRVSGFNQLNHGLDLDTSLLASRHFALHLTDQFAYQTGIFQPRTNEGLQAVPVAPGSPNTSVFVPLVRQLNNQSQIEADWDTSRRTSLNLLGGFALRDFRTHGSATGLLFNSHTWSGGLGLTHRLTPTVKFGARYLFETVRFAQNASDDIHSGFLTFAWQVRPAVTFELYGGPEYAIRDERALALAAVPTPPASSPPPAALNHWDGGAGGALTWRLDRTVLRFSADRQLGEGGGLLLLSRNSTESAELRRRLSRNWDLVLTTQNGQSVSSSSVFGPGRVRAQSAGISLEYTVLGRLVLHFSYVFERQRTSGAVPFGVGFDRSRGGMGIFYQLAQAPL